MLSKNKIKVGIAPINWSNDDMHDLGGDISFEDCIKEMSMAGFTGCEVGHKFPRDVEVLQSCLAPHNLSIASAWFSTYFTIADSCNNKYQQTIDDFKIHIEFLHNMGAKVVVVAECGDCIHQDEAPILIQKPKFDIESWDKLIKGMEQLGEIAGEYEMDIAYHPHMGTGVQIMHEIENLMANTSKDKVSILLDTGHLYFAGVDNLEFIDKFHDRIKHVHLKDIRADVLGEVKRNNLSFLKAVKRGVFTVPGDGAINFKPIFRALAKYNYNGWVIIEAEQDPIKAPPLEYATKGRKYLLTTAGI